MVPVAQKVQPIWQPTWLLTHSVECASWRMMTASTSCLSCSSMSSFVVDLSALVRASMRDDVVTAKREGSSA